MGCAWLEDGMKKRVEMVESVTDYGLCLVGRWYEEESRDGGECDGLGSHDGLVIKESFAWMVAL